MYVASQNNVTSDRECGLISPASGETLIGRVRTTMASGDGTSTTSARSKLQRCTSLNTTRGVDKLNTRSRAAATSANEANVAFTGSILLFPANGIFGMLSGQWQAPRPWATPRLINGEQACQANDVTASSPSQGWFNYWDEAENLESQATRLRGRRARRRGLASYRTEQNCRNLAIANTPCKTWDNKWVCYVKETPERGHSMPHTIFDANASIAAADTETETETGSVAASLSASDSATIGDNPGTPITASAPTTTPEFGLGGGRNFTVNLPAYAAGDVVVITCSIEAQAIGLTNASATGWTQLAARSNDQYSVAVLYRVMDGTEGSTVAVTLSQNCNHAAAAAIAYSHVDPVNPIDGAPLTGATTSTNTGFTTGTLTTANPNEMAVLCQEGGGTSAITSTPAGATREVAFNNGGAAREVLIADNPIPGAGTSCSFTASYLNTFGYSWVFFLLKSAASSGSATVGPAASDSGALSSTSSVASLTDTAKASSDSAAVSDAIGSQPRGDSEFAGLTESNAVSTATPTAKTDSDSAVSTAGGSVSFPITPASSDSATLSSTTSIDTTAATPLQDNDVTAVLTEAARETITVFGSDSGAVTQNDGGPPGGGGAGDGGGTGADGGPGIRVTHGRIHVHHTHPHATVLGGVSAAPQPDSDVLAADFTTT